MIYGVLDDSRIAALAVEQPVFTPPGGRVVRYRRSRRPTRCHHGLATAHKWLACKVMDRSGVNKVLLFPLPDFLFNSECFLLWLWPTVVSWIAAPDNAVAVAATNGGLYASWLPERPFFQAPSPCCEQGADVARNTGRYTLVVHIVRVMTLPLLLLLLLLLLIEAQTREANGAEGKPATICVPY